MPQLPDKHTWPDHLVAEDDWRVYHRVITAARARGLRFAVGGGFAVAAYTGHWRETKDIDLYTLPANREAFMQVTLDAGLSDLYPRSPYDRRWIYRSVCGDAIVDIIWAMANHRAQVDEQWLREGGEIFLRGERLEVVPAEEMVWNKLYVMQHDRCDWPDVLNLLHALAPILDWDYLIHRMGDDIALLAAALSVYRWVCPGRARSVPAAVWERLQVPPPPPDAHPPIEWHHVTLLDIRPWFAVLEPK